MSLYKYKLPSDALTRIILSDWTMWGPDSNLNNIVAEFGGKVNYTRLSITEGFDITVRFKREADMTMFLLKRLPAE